MNESIKGEQTLRRTSAVLTSKRVTYRAPAVTRARNNHISISALQLITDEEGTTAIPTLLTSNADLEVCGNGFNPRIVKVRWKNFFYLVFREDLKLII